MFQLYPGISIEFGSNKIFICSDCSEHEGSEFKKQITVGSILDWSTDFSLITTNAWGLNVSGLEYKRNY